MTERSESEFELAGVIRRRRMTRQFSAEPVDRQLLTSLLDTARRAPSAGFSQGTSFLVLVDDDLARFWSSSGAGQWFGERQPGVLDAPVVVVPFGDPAAYTTRYTAPDKAAAGLDVESAWPVPYWLVDTAMATQNLLLLVEDAGLGALFFGLFGSAEAALRDFGVPERLCPIGAVAIGHRAVTDQPSGSPRTHRRRPLNEVVHWGSWPG